MSLKFEDWMTHEERLNHSYRMAQVTMGITKVLKVQMKAIGFKAWSKMDNNEKSTSLFALRKLWSRENKKDADV